ncbi:MAG: HD domain-containing protein [Marinilabiliaceae bacterium]|nr:HD domain-containing protein [Marinilabiliaceae bacterium]
MLQFISEIDFIIEIDKLKSVFRKSLVLDQSKNENSAEHSWHLAVAVTVLEPYANFKNMDMLKVTRMALIHDIVEIDAGDTYAYDDEANKLKHEKEVCAADRIYGLLQNDRQNELKNLWYEFEKRESPEAKFVDAVDRFIPIMINYLTQGKQWKAFGVTATKVLTRNNPINDGSTYLWKIVNEIVKESVEKGYLIGS